MSKKYLSITVICSLLTACSSTNVIYTPKYKISDEDVKEIILIGNNLEHCVHPELKGLTFEEADKKVYRKYTQEERILWNNVHVNTIYRVIGERDATVIMNDPASQAYLAEKFTKYNNQIANIDPAECKTFKKEYKNTLHEIKKQIEIHQKQVIAQQKEEEQQRKKQQIQAEKDRKAREAYLRTPQGQAELARQQQLAYQQQMLEQQRQYQQQMLDMQRQAAQQATFQQFSNTINSGLQSVTQTMQKNTQLINQMNQNMRSSCQSIGNGWGNGGWINVCY